MFRSRVELASAPRTGAQSRQTMLHRQRKRVADRYQRCLDAVTRVTIPLAGKDVSSWRALAGAGLLLGALCLLLLSWSRGLGALPALVIIAVNLVTFHLVNVLSTRLVGWRRIVLLEQFVAALLTTALASYWLAAPVLAVLDVWALAMAAGLAIGRVGCLMTGCCHGRPARIGLSYPWRIQFDAPRPLRVLRFTPVQGYEAFLLGAAFLLGLLLLLTPTHDGAVFIFFLVVYSAGRYGLEFLRGDTRPYWRGLSEAQLTCLGLLGLAAALALTAGDPPRTGSLGWIALGLLTIAGISLVARSQFGEPLFDPMHPGHVCDLRTEALAANANSAPSDNRAGAIVTSTGLTITPAAAAEGEAYLLHSHHRRLDAATARAVSLLLAHADAPVAGQLRELRPGVYRLGGEGSTLPPALPEGFESR